MNRILLTVGTGALAIAIAACGSDSTSPLLSNQDVTSADSSMIAAQAGADEAVSDVNMVNGVSTTMGWSLANSNSGVSMSLVPSQEASISADLKSDCTYNSVDGRFHCLAKVNGNGITVIRTFAFFDTTGTMMNHFDSTTASMNVQATLSGIDTTANGADTVNATRNLTATGLFGAHNTTRIWNGTGDGTHGSLFVRQRREAHVGCELHLDVHERRRRAAAGVEPVSDFRNDHAPGHGDGRGYQVREEAVGHDHPDGDDHIQRDVEGGDDGGDGHVHGRLVDGSGYAQLTAVGRAESRGEGRG